MVNTNISWCHHTLNFWWGCEKVSPACAHCYAEKLSKFFSRGKASWGANGLRWIRTAAAIEEVRKLDASARRRGVNERVFVNSMSDTFEDWPDLVAPRTALFEAIRTATNLTFLLLTKRPENWKPALIASMKHNESEGGSMAGHEWLLDWADGTRPPANIWLGTTAEDQTRADERIPVLLSTPAAKRFLSCEPLLGPVDLTRIGQWRGEPLSALEECVGNVERPAVDWVIVGGESGGGARPMRPDWARALRDQCAASGVAFHLKQWGEFLGTSQFTAAGLDPELALNTPFVVIDDKMLHRVGKARAGRLLDGRTYDGFPVTATEGRGA